MTSIGIEERHAVSDPFLRTRVEAGKRLGTREFVALVDGREAGLLIFEHFPNSRMGVVYEIFVLPDFRRKGVGRLLLDRADFVALASACKELRLHARSLDQAHVDDAQLMSWYGRSGFERDASDPGWMKKNLNVG